MGLHEGLYFQRVALVVYKDMHLGSSLRAGADGSLLVTWHLAFMSSSRFPLPRNYCDHIELTAAQKLERKRGRSLEEVAEHEDFHEARQAVANGQPSIVATGSTVENLL
ncbi:hypothetical protein F444_16021 [Phytophthora nicotianae P1976]|uniref:Uncharacterized protein n=1 Tax=Phytophthora nicotianae P1976 TaxID=1317066 RepID=A0A080ZJX1_PHYNI|nr:hypothetical protein F444_16021 [Phytophthora nicotianae P1976]